MKTQEELDEIIRKQKGKHAVEALVYEDSKIQTYELSNGARLWISKETGHGEVITATGGRAARTRKF